jgi:hypothetical protein
MIMRSNPNDRWNAPPISNTHALPRHLLLIRFHIFRLVFNTCDKPGGEADGGNKILLS